MIETHVLWTRYPGYFSILRCSIRKLGTVCIRRGAERNSQFIHQCKGTTGCYQCPLFQDFIRSLERINDDVVVSESLHMNQITACSIGPSSVSDILPNQIYWPYCFPIQCTWDMVFHEQGIGPSCRLQNCEVSVQADKAEEHCTNESNTHRRLVWSQWVEESSNDY